MPDDIRSSINEQNAFYEVLPSFREETESPLASRSQCHAFQRRISERRVSINLPARELWTWVLRADD